MLFAERYNRLSTKKIMKYIIGFMLRGITGFSPNRLNAKKN